jgi:hypothetical protein
MALPREDGGHAMAPGIFCSATDWERGTCGWRIVISPIFPQDPKLNVALLHCAQRLPQDQFARDRVESVMVSSTNRQMYYVRVQTQTPKD